MTGGVAGIECGASRKSEGSTDMGLRNTLPLFALLLTFRPDGAFAQQTPDIDGVRAASKAFYEAVVVVDDGTAMEKVWAQTPYVTYVGPRSTAIILGWEAQKKYWTEFNKPFSQRSRWCMLMYALSAILPGKSVPRAGSPR